MPARRKRSETGEKRELINDNKRNLREGNLGKRLPFDGAAGAPC